MVKEEQYPNKRRLGQEGGGSGSQAGKAPTRTQCTGVLLSTPRDNCCDVLCPQGCWKGYLCCAAEEMRLTGP